MFLLFLLGGISIFHWRYVGCVQALGRLLSSYYRIAIILLQCLTREAIMREIGCS
jgi:hypothetical protein